MWPVQQASANINGVIVDPLYGDFELYTSKIVLVRIPPGGQTNKQIISLLEPIIAAGASGIVAIAKNDIGEMVAYNTSENLQPWKVPVVVVAPKDSLVFIQAACARRQVSLQVNGTLRETEARSVTGTIGTGNKYIIISTPISGWFTCGGERGPGIAIFNALAAWAVQQKNQYTFLFTANSGHELNNLGAHVFIEKAPKPEDVYLWLHLGAGIATVDWKKEDGTLKKLSTVDPKRNIMYSENLEHTIDQAFRDQPGKRWKIRNEALGELAVVAAHGYKRFFGIAYGHPLHHMPTDDATTTNPQILQDAAITIRKALEIELAETIVKTY
ncbi:MAG TPA: hypothetical protein VIN08_16150 [Ohtaekwangia sp.]|uniref:hypothetical protein n=1 Tax=Ohtaekwangia sp. TaxID=2066019 RepID=UPI002F92A907